MFTYIRYHYVHLGFLKFRDIVKIYNCLFLYDYASDKKPCNFPSTSFPGPLSYPPYGKWIGFNG